MHGERRTSGITERTVFPRQCGGKDHLTCVGRTGTRKRHEHGCPGSECMLAEYARPLMWCVPQSPYLLCVTAPLRITPGNGKRWMIGWRFRLQQIQNARPDSLLLPPRAHDVLSSVLSHQPLNRIMEATPPHEDPAPSQKAAVSRAPALGRGNHLPLANQVSSPDKYRTTVRSHTVDLPGFCHNHSVRRAGRRSPRHYRGPSASWAALHSLAAPRRPGQQCPTVAFLERRQHQPP
jgi:hypothetical protein